MVLNFFIPGLDFWPVVRGCIGPYLPARELFFHLGPLCLTLPYPAYGHFKGGPPTGQTACGHLLPLWTPHALRLWQLLAIGGQIKNDEWVLLSLSKFGPWPVAYGLWPVGYGLWAMVCGLWAIVCGL